MDFAGGVGVLAVPLLATAWGASPGLLGYIGTAGGLGYVAMAAVAGPLSDRVGRTKLPLIGAVSISLLFFLYPWLPGPVYMVPLALIIGMAWGLLWPPMESWIADVFEGRHLTRALSGFNVSWSTGSTIGILLAGYLFELRPWLPFLVTVLVPLAVAATLPRLPKPERKGENHSPVEDHPNPVPRTDPTELWIAWTVDCLDPQLRNHFRPGCDPKLVPQARRRHCHIQRADIGHYVHNEPLSGADVHADSRTR